MPKLSVKQAEKKLIAYGLAFPEAKLEHLWGHDALKVKGKIFATFDGELGEPGEFSMTVKLPISAEMATTLSWVEPSHYGLGKHGWVSARLREGDAIDLETMRGWLAQSYCAIAPKKLAKLL